MVAERLAEPCCHIRTLGLLLEDGLGLTTVTLLLANVTALTLGKLRGLTGLVLSHLVGPGMLAARNVRVLPALLALAIGPAGLRDVDHLSRLATQPSWRTYS